MVCDAGINFSSERELAVRWAEAGGKYDQGNDPRFLLIERLTKSLAHSRNLRVDLEDGPIQPVKVPIELATSDPTVPPKLLEGQFETLDSFLIHLRLDILAVVFGMRFLVLGRHCGVIDDRIGIIGPLSVSALPFIISFPWDHPKLDETPSFLICPGPSDMCGSHEPIVALGINILLPRNLIRSGKAIRKKQQSFAKPRVLGWEILNDNNP